MPRKSRIDASGALHHIIVRGIERHKIFSDDADRNNFIDRVGVTKRGQVSTFDITATLEIVY
jgi:hypothetical protein